MIFKSFVSICKFSSFLKFIRYVFIKILIISFVDVISNINELFGVSIFEESKCISFVISSFDNLIFILLKLKYK